MKNIKNQTPKHNTKFNENKHIPEIRDNIDSREGEEQEIKGDDITHNRKKDKSKKPGKQ